MISKDNYLSTEQENICSPITTVYFRCANKITYPLKLEPCIDLDQLKRYIAKDQKVNQMDLRFIHQGKELQNLLQLKPRHFKCIVHVVNLPKIYMENLKVSINFANKFKEDYKVTKSMKIHQFLQEIKQKHKLNKVVLIHLGTILKPYRTFEEHMIEDRSCIYATGLEGQNFIGSEISNTNNEGIKHSVKTLPMTNASNIEQSQSIKTSSAVLFGSFPPIDEHEQKRYKQTSSKTLFSLSQERYISETDREDKSFSEQSRGKIVINELGIPISDVFDVHKHVNLSFFKSPQPLPQESNNKIQFSLLSSLQQLKKRAESTQNLLFSSKDFIFSGEEELPQTSNFLSKFLYGVKKNLQKKR